MAKSPNISLYECRTVCNGRHDNPTDIEGIKKEIRHDIYKKHGKLEVTQYIVRKGDPRWFSYCPDDFIVVSSFEKEELEYA